MNSSPRMERRPPENRAPGKSEMGERIAQSLILGLLFAVPSLMCVRAACVADPDVWWHLRTAQWIIQHHAVPQVDSFSRVSAGKPWAAYSWLFELIVLQLFQRLGLAGLVAYSSAMVLAITVALHHLIKRLQPDYSLAILMTFATSFVLMRLYTPRPWLFTILFFVLLVDIVMHARITGRARELGWLPLIFAVWANVHVQFVAGLAVLGLALAESVLARWLPAVQTRIPAKWLGAALAASVLGTLANPYGWHIYQVVYGVATQPGGLNKISELQALPFRSLTDFGVLLFAMGAAAVLARKPRLPLFEAGLLGFAVMVSFRSQRDLWAMAVVGITILAAGIRSNRKNRSRVPRFAGPLLAVGAAIAVALGFRVLQANNPRLQTGLAVTMPVAAVDAIKAANYSGPLFNDFNWGGYLIWSLRMPVSIDGRGSMHGDAVIDRSVATWNAAPDWASDPEFTSAKLVIGPVTAPLTQMLRMDAGYRLVYEDKLAAVFVRR
jgi:hypothetical protein